MMRHKFIFVGIFVALVIALQGCATNQILVQKDYLKNVSALKIIRYETPKISGDAGMIAGFLLFGAFGKGFAESIGDKSPLDLTGLIAEKFAAQAKKEITYFPTMDVQCEPVKNDYSCPSCDYIEFRTDLILLGFMGLAYGGGYGIRADSIATFKDHKGDVLWRKKFVYISGKFKRNKDNVEEFKVNNGKLLIEEIDFAAEATASDFIRHLKGH